MKEPPISSFHNSVEHLLAELERIDLLIRLAVRRSRELHKADEQFQGLYISDEEVDRLLDKPIGVPLTMAAAGSSAAPDGQALLNSLRETCAQRRLAAEEAGVELRLAALARDFNLDPFEIDCVLICLAPELDLRYERLYAWLQDDVTKKRPSVDLLLNLLCGSLSERILARDRFSGQSPLIGWRILRIADEQPNGHAPLLARQLYLDQRVASWLLDSDRIDPLLFPHLRVFSAGLHSPTESSPTPELALRLKQVFELDRERMPIIYLQGCRGSGRKAIAAALCLLGGQALLVVDGPAVSKAEGLDPAEALRLAIRESILSKAALYWDGFDDLLSDDKRSQLDAWFTELGAVIAPIFVAGNSGWEPSGSLRNARFIRVEFPRPDAAARRRLWTRALEATALGDEELALVAEKFRFTEGQIFDSVATASNLAAWRRPEQPRIEIEDVYAACRLQGNQKLSSLARKIKPRYGWNDIILPDDHIEQLREICAYVKYRSLVYDVWGFGRKGSLGRGLNLLFAGPSGTGKTMAADIMAHELRLDLYKIDLSTVVSKYIGETEKNLSKIFEEAENSNAILFFDEADALFGKRSEVRDAHDRYANIEVGFLLQKMEEHEGVVIMATNFRKNMDDAFIRRIQFTVDFPSPAEGDRRRIWEAIWPQDVLRSPDLDLDHVAASFELSGGNIRNIALAAAFLAADDGKRVKMDHVIRAIRREYQKMGKVVMEGEFAVPGKIS